MFDVRPVALASFVLAACAAAPASAGLVTTPATPNPIIQQPPARPAPPATIHYSMVDGWRIGIGQVDAPNAICGRPSTFVGVVYPGANVHWTYHFVRSDGSETQPIEVPAAPNVPGAKLGGKAVRDIDGPARAGVSDRLAVDANGQAMQTEALNLDCHA